MYIITPYDNHSPEVIEFIKMNARYIYEHGLTIHDLKKAQIMREAIQQRNLKNDKPCDLDVVHYVNEYGQKYPNAIIAGDTYRNNTTALCENGSAHVSLYEDEITYSISGGNFPTIDPDKLISNGTRERLFWTWGSCGPCGNGGIYFTAKVKYWKLSY